MVQVDTVQNSLADVESALKALTLDASNIDAITALANASRESTQVRERLADKATLTLLIEVIDCSIDESFETLDLALRCLGNACADNDEARDITVAIGFTWALRCFATNDDQTELLTTKVLYNICNDHEAAQRQCYDENVHVAMIKFLSSEFARVDEEKHECAAELLLWITGHNAAIEPHRRPAWPTDILELVVRLPAAYGTNTDTDTFACLVESALVFLRDEAIQKQIIKNQLLADVRNILRLTREKSIIIQVSEGSDADDLKVLQPLATSLLWCISDCAAQAEDADALHLCRGMCTFFIKLMSSDKGTSANAMSANGSAMQQHHLPPSDRAWLAAESTGLLLAASCQELGNLLRKVDPKTWEHLVETEGLDQWLYSRILGVAEDPESAVVLHSITGVLIQLTRASQQVRETMGSSENALPALERLCLHDMPQIKQEGVRLLRALGKDCSANQQRFAELARDAVIRMKESSDDTGTAEIDTS